MLLKKLLLVEFGHNIKDYPKLSENVSLFKLFEAISSSYTLTKTYDNRVTAEAEMRIQQSSNNPDMKKICKI